MRVDGDAPVGMTAEEAQMLAALKAKVANEAALVVDGDAAVGLTAADSWMLRELKRTTSPDLGATSEMQYDEMQYTPRSPGSGLQTVHEDPQGEAGWRARKQKMRSPLRSSEPTKTWSVRGVTMKDEAYE